MSLFLLVMNEGRNLLELFIATKKNMFCWVYINDHVCFIIFLFQTKIWWLSDLVEHVLLIPVVLPVILSCWIFISTSPKWTAISPPDLVSVPPPKKKKETISSSHPLISRGSSCGISFQMMGKNEFCWSISRNQCILGSVSKRVSAVTVWRLKINELTPPGVVAWCMGIGAIGQVQEAGAQGMTWGPCPRDVSGLENFEWIWMVWCIKNPQLLSFLKFHELFFDTL